MKFRALSFTHILIIFIFLPTSPATSQPSTPPPPVSTFRNNTANVNPQVGMIGLILTIFIFLMAFLSVFIRNFCLGNSSASVAHLSPVLTRGRRHGLDASVIDTFPTFDYSAVKALKIGKGALECSVCLNEFEDDETLRLIPKCDHVFHSECIDMWLESHATCPVCRANLFPVPGESLDTPSIGTGNRNDDVAIDVITQGGGAPAEGESMDQPLNVPRLIRRGTRGSTSGRRRWFSLVGRSHSTGHVAVTQAENMERFTLRVPEEVRNQIISGKLCRTTSCIATPTGGSSRGRMFGSGYRAERWVVSLTPPFFSTGMGSPGVSDQRPGQEVDSFQKAPASHPPLPPV